VGEGTLDFTLTKPADAQLLVSIQRVEIWRATDILLGAGVLIIARLLGAKKRMLLANKSDLADGEVVRSIRAAFPADAVHMISARSGDNLEAVTAFLRGLLRDLPDPAGLVAVNLRQKGLLEELRDGVQRLSIEREEPQWYAILQAVVEAMKPYARLGVHVNVDTYINDPKAARANPGHRGQVIKPGYQKLDADHALVYVRSRDFPDADFTRMRHQQTFFKALAKEASATRNLPRLPAFVRNVARTVSTDMQLGLMLKLASELRGIPDKNIQTATLEGEWQSPYVVTDQAKAKQLIGNMMAGRDFKPASNPKNVVPGQFKVVVRNGSGVSGLAQTASGRLRAIGFKIGEVGNAKRQDYPTTLIVYRGDYGGVAARVRQTIRRGKLINDVANQYKFTGDVMVVVGRDWRSADSSTTSSTATKP